MHDLLLPWRQESEQVRHIEYFMGDRFPCPVARSESVMLLPPQLATKRIYASVPCHEVVRLTSSLESRQPAFLLQVFDLQAAATSIASRHSLDDLADRRIRGEPLHQTGGVNVTPVRLPAVSIFPLIRGATPSGAEKV